MEFKRLLKSNALKFHKSIEIIKAYKTQDCIKQYKEDNEGKMTVFKIMS